MRIGIFCGTFSPPHIGHVAAVKAFMEQMWLDILYVVPSPVSETDDEVLSAVHRVAMCERAFGDIDGVVISDIELRRREAGCTADTLRQIYQLSEPGSRLFLLLGTDTLLTLHDRQGVEDIFRLSYPVYMRREGPDPVLEALIVKQIGMLSAKYNKVVRRITGEALPVSGTQIRRLRATGGSITGLVPISVEQYISDHDLYV